MKTAIIFGVTGQAGSYLAELLLSKEYRVVGVSRRVSVPNDQRITHLRHNNNFSLLRGDVTDASSVYRILEEVEPNEIYNLAAQSHVGLSFDEPIHTTNVVYLGCLNILEWLRLWHQRQDTRPRFYQASSSEMFGTSYTLDVDPEGYVERYDCDFRFRKPEEVGARIGEPYQDEQTPMLPCSPYAVAKLAAHNAVRVYREAYGIFACSGILFNHESPRRGEEFVTRKITKYVSRYAYSRRHEEPLPPLKLGNLQARRDWGHAKDYVQAMWLMLQADTPGDYVVATGETHTVEEFLLKAFAVIGFHTKTVSELPVEIDESLFRPCEVPLLRGYALLAREKLGWEPQVSFDELVKQMVLSDIANMWGDKLALQ